MLIILNEYIKFCLMPFQIKKKQILNNSNQWFKIKHTLLMIIIISMIFWPGQLWDFLFIMFHLFIMPSRDTYWVAMFQPLPPCYGWAPRPQTRTTISTWTTQRGRVTSLMCLSLPCDHCQDAFNCKPKHLISERMC